MSSFLNPNHVQHLRNQLRRRYSSPPPPGPSGIKLLYDPPEPAVAEPSSLRANTQRGIFEQFLNLPRESYFSTNLSTIRDLRQDSETLSRTQDSFHTMIQSHNNGGHRPVEITCFYEELPTSTVGIVQPAILPGYRPIGIRSNHQDMTKFASPEEAGFMAICAEIQRWVKEMSPLTAVPGPLRPGSEGTEVPEPSSGEVEWRAGYLQDATHPVDPNSNTGDENEFVNLAQFLPDCSHGSMLVRTRNEEAGLKLVPGRSPIEVEMMDDAESAPLVRAMVGDVGATDDKIPLLSRRLDYLPLALAQASAFMLESRTTIDRYLSLLDRSDEAVVHFLSPPDNAADRDSNVPHAVMLTWVVSFERIAKQNELASTLLLLMALFDHQAISKDLLTECWTSVGVLSRSKSLSSASSLKRRRSASSDGPSSEESSAPGAVGGDNSKESVRYPFQEGESGGAPQWPTQDMTAEVWQKSNAGEVRINPTYPDSHHIEQYFSDMLDMGYNAFAIRERKKRGLMPSYAADQVQDPNHHEQADFPASSSQSFSHMRSQDQCNDDLDQYARHKEDETRPGPREWTAPVGFTMCVSPPPVWMLPFDADLEARFTRIRSAGPSLWEDSSSSVFFTELEKALAARKWLSKDPSESSFEREALHAMARAFPIAHYENLDQCRKMLPHAHAVLRSNVAENDQTVLLRSILYENLARFYINVGQFGVVPQLLQQALTRAANELEEHDPLVLQMIRILAVALCDLGRSKESTPWLSRLMALERKNHSKSHPKMLRAMSALAVYFQIEGKHRQAESILTEAVENIDIEQLNHLMGAMRVDITLQLVGVLFSSRRHQEALARSSEALAVLEKKRCYPLDHPVALKIFAVQAIILRKQGQFEKAESICRKALEGRDISSDPAQPYLVSIMEELEKALIGMHRFDEAEQVRAIILRVRVQTCQSGRRTTSHSPEPSGPVVEEGTRGMGPEEMPIYTLDASVRLFDSCLLQKLEDHASDTSHKAHIKREALRTIYYPAPKNLRRHLS
ncbi:hypothetical protein CPLU01_05647 [Colletotrichum plurivorum]|uniref:Tetratricopeptide n=1 Tax=Colletotrichum plurivorum TaxID=2175906 RepID=A0A8H6NI37_9PEZI|nr:hypothetical protein CPLU01_05647 [Colletotrichum plurivorum]